VVEGQDIVARIAQVPRSADDRPLTPIEIVNILIQREGPSAPRVEPALAPIERPAPPSEPAEVSEGQTIEQVVAGLGQPLRKAKIGAKEIYYYKELKVVFLSGKVKDVQ
jgi:hypothetical protein